MILDLQQITDIINKNPNKDLVANAVTYNKRLRMHIYGENIATYLPKIEGFERAAMQTLRTKWATSNKDLWARTARPIDKVFSARGGSIYYNLSKDQDSKASALTSNLKGGISTKAWIESYWKPHFLDDPMGFIFIEIDENENAYPTYKSITSVFDYQLNGVSLDYVVFNVDNKTKLSLGLKKEAVIYRVVDDLFDYYVQKDGDTVTVIDDQTFPNYFMRVPAILNSDIANSQSDGFVSLFDEAIQLADEYLLKKSIKITHDFYHGFPKYWEYADDCAKCGGQKSFEGATCPDCKGTGKRIMTSVSDVKLLSYPQDKETPIVTPNVLGYGEPSDIFHKISTETLAELEEKIHTTIWGAMNTAPKTQGMATDKGGGQRTATEIVTDQQPMIDRLNLVAASAEKRDKFIRDMVIDFKLKQGYSESGGSSVNYGRRYMIESPDQVWDRYATAREKSGSVSVLDDLLLEFIESKYQGDPIGLSVQKKLMRLEPFVHLTIAQCDGIVENEIDYIKKLYFAEWVNSLQQGQLIVLDEPTLKEMLTEFATNKLQEVQQSVQAKQEREAKAQQAAMDLKVATRLQTA